MTVQGLPDALSVVCRAVSFVLLLQAAGTVMFIAVWGGLLQGRPTMTATRTLGGRLAIAAAVFVTAHYLLEAGRMAGELAGVVDPAMQLLALQSSTGAAFAMRLLGLVLIAIGLHRRAPLALAIIGAVIAIAAFTLTGHTSDNPWRAAAATLLIVHLLVAAFWLGALCPLYISTGLEPPAVTATVIGRFSRLAATVVPTMALAGVALAALLVPAWSVFSQPYGQLLLAKLALFVVLMGMAALNKWIFGPACAQEDPRAARAFRTMVALEFAVICGVLAVTATLTTFYSPEAA
jgi:putative copper resistance protein D